MAQPTIVADITETSVQINEGAPQVSIDIGTSPVTVTTTPSTIATNQTQPLVQVTLVPNPSLTVTVGQPAIIVDVTGVGGNTDWNGIVNKPSTFPPTLPINESDVNNLVSDLAGKVGTSDPRLSDARTPLAHAPTHSSAGSDPVTISNTQVTGLGTASVKDAPASGNASSGQVVIGSDTRLTDARTPVAHASTHAHGGSDPVTITYSDLASIPSTFTPSAHASTHAHGGSDPVTITYSDLSGIPSTFAPSAHHTTHEHGGSDAVSITYSDLLSIPSSFAPSAHQTTHEHGGSDPVAITYSDLLSIPSTFAPSAHETSHITGGSDIIPAPTTSKSGLVPVLPSTSATSKFLRGDATFVAVDYSTLTSVPSTFTPSGHHTTHEHGGSDPVSITYSDLLSIPSTFAPSAHETSHIAGGSDVIPAPTTSASGLVPVLPASGGTGKFLRGDASFVAVDYSNLTSVPTSFAPSAHHASHQPGGSDQVTLAYSGQSTLDFGSTDNGGSDYMVAQTTVSATWLTASSFPTVTVCTGQDHTDSDDAMVEELLATVGNIVIGTSFDVILWAPNGASGKYAVNYFSNY